MKQKVLIFMIFIWILSSCTQTETNIKNTNSKENKEQAVYKVNSIEKVLQIDEKCIGCGKCARIAPLNFKMNFETRKAEVISQKNIDSTEVARSIQICPVDSISIG
ncbi:MAG: ferredoxin [Candidatus Gracilibacteria bacterium]|nr:ferredoxin [Candidatus Gracilibacteria bacterium]